MDHPPPAPLRSEPAWLRPGLLLLIAAGFAWYLIFLVRHVSPHAAGADSSGYMNSARLLNEGKFLVPARALPGHTADEFGSAAYQPLGFLLQDKGDRMAPTYPIGLPLHLVLGAKLTGWERAAISVSLFSVLASGGLVWAFARQLGLARGTAVAGVLTLWLCPLFFFSAIQPMSDVLALTWTLAALYCVLRARERLRWGVLGGAALGLAVLVRPSDLLVVVPVLVALGWQWRAYLAVGVGGLPSAALLFYYNWKVYGSPFTTGYGDVRSAFSAEFLPHNLLHFATWIPGLLSPLVVLVVAAPFVPQIRRRGYAVLAAWAATLIGFYAFYYHSGETWWYLRFILPAFPVLILAALAVLETLWRATRAFPVARAAGAALLLLATAGWQVWQNRQLDVVHFERNERSYPDAARWARQHLPPNSAIFCMQVSGAFFYYTDFVLLRWEQILPKDYAPLFNVIAQQDRPVYAALYDFETADAQARVGGHWTKLASVGQVTFWRRQP